MKGPKIKYAIKKIVLAVIVTAIGSSSVCCTHQPDGAYEIKYSYYLDSEFATGNENNEKFRFNKKEWEANIIEDGKEYITDNDNIWEVSLENNKIMILSIQTQIPEVNPSNQYEVKPLRFDLDDGYFISRPDVDYGGISGIIDFVGNDEVSYSVSNRVNPLVIFAINDDIFLLEGMSQRSVDRGHLYKFCKIDGKWRIKKAFDGIFLNGYPYQYVIDKSDIYIIIYERIYDDAYYDYTNFHKAPKISRVIKISTENGELNMQEIVKTVFIPANSMIKKDNVLYIGLRGSVATVDLKSNEINFYTKK